MENTIKAYLDTLLEKYADNEALCDLANSLLVYGAAAQQYVGQSEDSFVTEIGELSAIPAFTVTKNGTASADYCIVGAGLRLDGAFDFGVQIKAASIQGLTLAITTANETTEIALSSANKVGDYYVVYFNELTALELSDDITFALRKNGEQIGKSLTMSANAYLYNASLGNDANLATLAKALYAYGVAAKAYQG